jgi:PAS domain S-box-containing protein
VTDSTPGTFGGSAGAPEKGSFSMTESTEFMDIFEHDPNFRSLMKRLFEIAVTHSFNAVMVTENKPGYPIVFVNQAFSDMTGYAREELMGQSPAILQGPKTERSVLDRLKEEISEGQIFHGQATNYRKDGSEFLMEWKIAPIRNAEDEITHYLALQRDITPTSDRS